MVVNQPKVHHWSEKTIDYPFNHICARFGAIFRAKVIANAMDYWIIFSIAFTLLLRLKTAANSKAASPHAKKRAWILLICS
ncbi:hypothetical protein SB57_00540 [Lactobacillus delbrueckii subsp. bulgaricus]|nr:hypothetical protein SB57_00540 [Lactobacillus delbrueckii subsp. bulgaricus]